MVLKHPFIHYNSTAELKVLSCAKNVCKTMPSFPNINLGSLMALPNIKTSFLGGILVENACQDIYLLHNADCKRQNISPRPVYVICTAKRQ